MNGKYASLIVSCALLGIATGIARAGAPGTVDAALYSTMPSTFAHRPVLSMDGDNATWFESATGMSKTDWVLVMLSHPVSVDDVTVRTGADDGIGAITNGSIESSSDGTNFHKIADFDSSGYANAKLHRASIVAVRIRTGVSMAECAIREITIDSKSPIAHVDYGPGRGFVDISQAPDLKNWADRAERQMEDFWPDIAALLYSDKFITPNAVAVIYRTEKDEVAATGDGVMDVNAAWCRKNPDDTGLTVHELTHVIQSYGDSNPPGWITEGIADYVRWTRFEPEHFHPNINVAKAKYSDKYRTSATFLAWCENHFDSRLVSKINDDARFGRYDDSMFVKCCGKNLDTLWSEFIADYQKDRDGILKSPTMSEDQPRPLPVVTPGSSIPVNITSLFTLTGIYSNQAKFDVAGGLDSGGTAYSANVLPSKLTASNVEFDLGPANASDTLTCDGQSILVPAGNYSSVWLLGCSTNGATRGAVFTIKYGDGTSGDIHQSMSDWFAPHEFPGELVASKMDYRTMSTGDEDPRAFYVYCYGLSLQAGNVAESIVLPKNPNIKLLAISLAR